MIIEEIGSNRENKKFDSIGCKLLKEIASSVDVKLVLDYQFQSLRIIEFSRYKNVDDDRFWAIVTHNVELDVVVLWDRERSTSNFFERVNIKFADPLFKHKLSKHLEHPSF